MAVPARFQTFCSGAASTPRVSSLAARFVWAAPRKDLPVLASWASPLQSCLGRRMSTARGFGCRQPARQRRWQVLAGLEVWWAQPMLPRRHLRPTLAPPQNWGTSG